MLAIAVELVVSALLLWFLRKQHLTVLGILPNKQRLLDLLVGFLLAGVLAAFYHLSTGIFSGNGWVINENYTLQTFFSASGWTLNSVLFEELIFRGALLYLIIKKNGIRNACIVSAACFGIYHWFSYGAFGNPAQMVFIFILTGAAGLAFAYAFAQTNSLYLPIGLHAGWNLSTIVVFSKGPLGQQLLLPENNNTLPIAASVITVLFQLLALPLFTFGYLRLSHRWGASAKAA